jgi:hypothetical protein
VPVTGKNSAGEATVKTYHLVFNIDQKSLIRLSGISGAPRVIAKLTNKLQQRLTERVEDGIEAEIRHETSEKLITGMRIITSPILAASTLINKRWSQESFARIGPVKFIKLVNEGRPDSNGDNYPNQPIAVVD